MEVKPDDLEVIEEYELEGVKRFRLRVRGTILVVNVAASSVEEAKTKAINIIKSMELDKVLSRLKPEEGG